MMIDDSYLGSLYLTFVSIYMFCLSDLWHYLNYECHWVFFLSFLRIMYINYINISRLHISYHPLSYCSVFGGWVLCITIRDLNPRCKIRVHFIWHVFLYWFFEK